MSENKIKSWRNDGYAKVTGRAKYADDITCFWRTMQDEVDGNPV